mgnify:CR=1 FL=1
MGEGEDEDGAVQMGVVKKRCCPKSVRTARGREKCREELAETKGRPKTHKTRGQRERRVGE